MIVAYSGGVFSVEVRQDAAGRYYVYERQDRQRRHSLTYETLDALEHALISEEIVWLKWQEVT